MPPSFVTASHNNPRIQNNLPSGLEQGHWYINGADGGHEFELRAPATNDLLAPIVVYIPGAGGLAHKKILQTHKTPIPSWSMIFNPQGTNRVKTPDYLIKALEFLRRVTEKSKKWTVVFGFSRGGAWVIDICQDHVLLCDVAIALAGYPWTKCTWANEREAKKLVSVQIPLLLLHFDLDEFCSPAYYKMWYEQFQIGMAMEALPRHMDPADNIGRRFESSFMSFVCEGMHVAGENLFYSLEFGQLSDQRPSIWWQKLWQALAKSRIGRRPLHCVT
jgi:hypothetical protein